MHRKFARHSQFNPFTTPGLLFAADDGGGGGGDDAAAKAATEAAAKVAADEAAAKAATDAAAAKAGGKDDDDKTDWKAESRKWEKQSKDNKTALDTTNAEKQSTLDAIAKALGLKDDDKIDPKKLAGDLTAAQHEARTIKVENAVLRAASKYGASPERLTDSKSFMTKLESLDPAAEDFSSKVAEKIKAAVEADASLKVAPGATRSSVSHTGGTGEGAARPTSIRDALARAQ